MNNFHYDVLYNRQPVIIDSTDVELTTLKKKWFYLNIVTDFSIYPNKTEDIWHVNKYKYTVLQPQESGEIMLYPASKKIISGIPDPTETLLAIQISKGQLIILPFHWKYLINVPVNCLGVNDLVSYFLV